MPYSETAAIGADLELGSTATTPVYTDIKGVHNGPKLTRSLEIITARHHSSTSTIKRPSFLDGGQMTFDLYYDSSEANHAALQTSFAAKTLRYFKCTLTDGGAEVYTFQAYVSQFDIMADVEGFNIASVTLDLYSAPTVS